LSRYLVRPRAWWFNKVPLSVTLVLLLGDGTPLTATVGLELVLVVLTVCAVANYGYALNDLYDVEEDFRAQRANAVDALGGSRTRGIVGGSAVIAEALAMGAAGWPGAMLTAAELMLPLAYSVPPLRIKERKWLGVAADALAAHVYPAALALLAAHHGWGRPLSAFLATCVLVWAAAAGIRGILSHQLHTAERDRQGGLETVVHDWGHLAIERFIMFVLLPVEVTAFIGAIAACSTGMVLWVLGGLYLVCELFRTLDGRFTVAILRPLGQPYVPFVDEAFYKAWGPIVIALDAARADLSYLVVIPLYALLFRPHMAIETERVRAIGRALSGQRRPG
jgi:4-hydroxybenzoate polyprenyltransferase